jgi:xyloglucan fucosyltransferase
VQIRRRKCNTDTPGHELACADRPGVEAYASVARALQLARGVRDADVRFFLAADEGETYAQARAHLGVLI